jgi:hypothetical protein
LFDGCCYTRPSAPPTEAPARTKEKV